MRALGTIYRYWITLLFLAVVAQIAGAAYGAFYAAQKLGDQKGSDEHKLISAKVFDHGFGFHTGFGYLIFLASIVLLLLALAVAPVPCAITLAIRTASIRTGTWRIRAVGLRPVGLRVRLGLGPPGR